MNKQLWDNIVFFSIILLGCSIIILLVPKGNKGNLYDYLKRKRLQYYYQQQFEKNKIVCHQCKGNGEYPTDVNKLMMDAKLQLFINKHFNVDKCDRCVKLPYGESYDYCDTVNDRYQTLVKEYAAAGPKIEMAACDQCMGAGVFTIRNTDGSYVTQQEYNEKHKKK